MDHPESQPAHRGLVHSAVARAAAALHTWQRAREIVCFTRLGLRGVLTARRETGAQPQAAVEWLGPLLIGGVEREALSCEPPSRLDFRVSEWHGGHAVAWCALAPGTTTSQADVEFRLTVRAADGRWERVCSKRLVSPGWSPPRWHRLRIAVPEGAADFDVTLSTHVPNGTATSAKAVWGDPRVERLRSLTELRRSFVWALRRLGPVGVVRRLAQFGAGPDLNAEYARWLSTNTATADDLRAMRVQVDAFRLRPRITVITPTYNTDPRWLRACIDSVRGQVYPDWELCLCDDGSTSAATRDVLREVEAASDPRVRVAYLETNQGISAASNRALEMATGDFVAMLDHDDELPADALFQVVSFLQDHDAADLIYSDEDKLDGRRCDPYFKPGWSPEHLLSCNYACHLLVVRRTLVTAVGGFRIGYEGAQDHDLVLRLMAHTSSVHHIPRILYHWRKIEGSAAASNVAKPWASDAGRRALADYARREGIVAEVEPGASPGQYRLRPGRTVQPFVSIVLAGAGARRPIGGAHIAALARSIGRFEVTAYDRYEVIVVEDGTLSGPAREALRPPHHRSVTLTNASGASLAARVNFGVSQATGEHVVICCDLVAPMNPSWLTALVDYSEQPHIGAVGAKLLYPDGSLRHVGIILGVMGMAALPFHGFPASFPGYFSNAAGVRNYSAVSGSCMMTRRAVFDDLGGFDPTISDRVVDIDYCVRLRQNGLRVVFTPYAELEYHGSDERPSIAADGADYERVRGRWGDLLERDPYYNPNLTVESPDYRPR